MTNTNPKPVVGMGAMQKILTPSSWSSTNMYHLRVSIPRTYTQDHKLTHTRASTHSTNSSTKWWQMLCRCVCQKAFGYVSFSHCIWRRYSLPSYIFTNRWPNYEVYDISQFSWNSLSLEIFFSMIEVVSVWHLMMNSTRMGNFTLQNDVL